ncbi:MAG: DUF1015 domain-containing protein [Proteobacteria bacterium]|nr:DUF1015 domain-containing protein [Pseudomonadota bacterium]MBU4035916.1 DUF1015 domain-containing protein [Pseudomonadota bacterium]
MANVIPFKGIIYNPQKIGDLAEVTTPPYDVINKEEQVNFHNRHPQNIIRLILGSETKEDNENNNRYTRAAAFFNKWLSEEILIADKSPVFYLTAIDFPVDGKMFRRFGLTALVGLEPFEKGIILPHEKTYSKTKSERLKLMKACHANFSPIFSLYSGKIDALNILEKKASESPADSDFIDGKGHRQRLWMINDANIQKSISSEFNDKILYIADGHHRYETALNYREWVSKNNPDFSPAHPANFIMMFICSMEDPGLIILPAHRLLSGIDNQKLSGFLQKAPEYFDITEIVADKNDTEKAKALFISSLRKEESKNKIGVMLKNSNSFYIISPKPGVMKDNFGNELSESLMDLDVTVLTRLILTEVLGFDQAGLDNENLISYSSSDKEAMENIISGEYDMAFILNPTKIEQVQRVAGEGLIMPRKSTYFYPKVITGQVMNKLF